MGNFFKIVSVQTSAPGVNVNLLGNMVNTDENFEIEAPPPRYRSETAFEKLARKSKEEPLVPLGCGLTTYFLLSGFKSFRAGDAVRSQKMMRGRVIAQGATVVALSVYAGYSALGGAEAIRSKIGLTISADTTTRHDEKRKDD